MLNFVRDGDIIVVYKLDRLARGVKGFIKSNRKNGTKRNQTKITY
jgi:DNA invertase Pin-like site-specific DNA recombinase